MEKPKLNKLFSSGDRFSSLDIGSVMRLNFGKVDAIGQLALCEDLSELQRDFG